MKYRDKKTGDLITDHPAAGLLILMIYGVIMVGFVSIL